MACMSVRSRAFMLMPSGCWKSCCCPDCMWCAPHPTTRTSNRMTDNKRKLTSAEEAIFAEDAHGIEPQSDDIYECSERQSHGFFLQNKLGMKWIKWHRLPLHAGHSLKAHKVQQRLSQHFQGADGQTLLKHLTIFDVYSITDGLNLLEYPARPHASTVSLTAFVTGTEDFIQLLRLFYQLARVLETLWNRYRIAHFCLAPETVLVYQDNQDILLSDYLNSMLHSVVPHIHAEISLSDRALIWPPERKAPLVGIEITQGWDTWSFGALLMWAILLLQDKAGSSSSLFIDSLRSLSVDSSLRQQDIDRLLANIEVTNPDAKLIVADIVTKCLRLNPHDRLEYAHIIRQLHIYCPAENTTHVSMQNSMKRAIAASRDWFYLWKIATGLPKSLKVAADVENDRFSIDKLHNSIDAEDDSTSVQHFMRSSVDGPLRWITTYADLEIVTQKLKQPSAISLTRDEGNSEKWTAINPIARNGGLVDFLCYWKQTSSRFIAVENNVEPLNLHIPVRPPFKVAQRFTDIHYQLELLSFYNHLLGRAGYGGATSGSDQPGDVNRLIRSAIQNGLIEVDIPRNLIGRIWSALLFVDVAGTDARVPMSAPPEDIERQLDVDLPRCHPYQWFIRSNQGRISLRRVIKAWISRHPDLVYWQGLDSIAAPFVALYCSIETGEMDVHLDLLERDNLESLGEYYALSSLSQLIKAYLYGFFQADNSKILKAHLSLLQAILRYADPELNHHMDKIGFSVDLFAIPLILTLFAHVLPIPKTVELWCHLLTRPFHVPTYPLFLIAASVSALRTSILSADFGECMQILSGGGDVVGADVEEICQVAWDICRTTPTSCFWNGKTFITGEFSAKHWGSLPEWVDRSRYLRLGMQDYLGLGNSTITVDVRPLEAFKKGHLPTSICADAVVGSPKANRLVYHAKAMARSYVVIVTDQLNSEADLADLLIANNISRVMILDLGVASSVGDGQLSLCECLGISDPTTGMWRCSHQ